MRTIVAWIFLLVTTLSVCGCGPAMGSISGTVTVNGQPLDKGFISFASADNGAAPITVDVVGGKYAAQMVAGAKRVQISAPIVKGQRKEYNGPDAPLVDITEESLPARYNSETELTCDVPRGSSTKDFAVERSRGSAK